MNFFLKSSFLLIGLIYMTNAFKIANICLLPKSNNCNQNDLNCIKCSGNHSQACGRNYCSLNKKSCGSFLPLLTKRIAYLTNPVMISVKDRLNYKKIEKIKVCPYQLEDHSCTKPQNCFYKRRKGQKETLRPIQCPCTKRFSYDCGGRICATNSDVCVLLSNKTLESIQLNPCKYT